MVLDWKKHHFGQSPFFFFLEKLPTKAERQLQGLVRQNVCSIQWRDLLSNLFVFVNKFNFQECNTLPSTNAAALDVSVPILLLATHRYLPVSFILTPLITSWLSPVVRFVRTFWLKGNKLPSFVQFIAGAGSPLTVQVNVTLDPICALWLTGALIIVGFRPSINGNKDVFYTVDLFRIPINKGTNSRLGWTKYSDLYEIVHPSLILISSCYFKIYCSSAIDFAMFNYDNILF